jgi:hypothetical protein
MKVPLDAFTLIYLIKKLLKTEIKIKLKVIVQYLTLKYIFMYLKKNIFFMTPVNIYYWV